MIRRIVSLSLLSAAACVPPLRLMPSDADRVLSRQLINAPDPSGPGTLGVKTLSYGSGKDKRRSEYREGVAIRTKTVDGSKLAVASWDGKARKKYWGFGMDSLPLNARVWYPDGPGPYPLALIVHGNHDMKDYSDPGYEYLGRHLASRGYILASVDENFINGGIGDENDARGWLLLKHLEVWKQLNDSSGGPFHRKVDLNNIAIMGHSRGGEAVGIAAAFNRLPHYPDDANLTFDFNFNIRSVIAIAPVDGQYLPAGRSTPVENVNYMVFHGTHDGDVSDFEGLKQYQRVRFTDGGQYFKAAFLMYRANHGQWNTRWGRSDAGPRGGRWLDLRGLIDPEDQRRFAKVVVTAFLDATLRGKREYLPLFRDHRTAGAWLPKSMYWTRFQESGFRELATFSEDIDVTSGTAPGVRLKGDSLATWREGQAPLRSKSWGWPGGPQKIGHGAVWLGWNNRIAGDDSTKMGSPARFTITIPDSVRSAWRVGSESALVFSLAPYPGSPGPRVAKPDSSKAKTDSAKRRPPKKPSKPKASAKDSLPIDLTVEVVDADGVTVGLPLSRYGVGRRPAEVWVARKKGGDQQRHATLYELVLQTYVIPLADFTASNPRFQPGRITAVRLTFDQTPDGTVVVSDVGLSTPDPAFMAGASGR